jgi:hypothetical protein
MKQSLKAQLPSPARSRVAARASDPAWIVCAALVLASAAVLLRIARVW